MPSRPMNILLLDSETTGLYPRDGMLGISLAIMATSGAYIDTNCFDDSTEQFYKLYLTKKQ